MIDVASMLRRRNGLCQLTATAAYWRVSSVGWPWTLALAVALAPVGCNGTASPAQEDQPAARATAASAAAGEFGPPASAGRPRPNILLIVICSGRYDHFVPAGYARPTTPFLQTLSEQGTFFENAVSSSSWTKPSMASILTGLTPNVHQMTDYYTAKAKPEDLLSGKIKPKRIMTDEIATLAECLRAAGYATACRINNLNSSEHFNMTQGFEDADTSHLQDTRQMVETLGTWLKTIDAARPFFALLFTRDAHVPYHADYAYFQRFDQTEPKVSPRGFRELNLRIARLIRKCKRDGTEVRERARTTWVDLYDACLAKLDDGLAHLPAVLESARRRSNTVILVTSDHGERFFDGGSTTTGHAWRLDEAVLRVPLIVSGPGIPQGRRVADLVRYIDIYPTVADLARAKSPTVLQGRSLLPLFLGEHTDFPPCSAFASFREEHHAVRLGGYKLLADPDRVELYDVRSDPAELHDIYASTPVEARKLEDELARWLAQEKALREQIPQAGLRELSPDAIEQLRALGYIE